MEKRFFGEIDGRGRQAVELFTEYGGFNKVDPKNFNILTAYMGAQRFRTPKGLDYLKQRRKEADHNVILRVLERFFQAYATMWSEGISENSEGATKQNQVHCQRQSGHVL